MRKDVTTFYISNFSQMDLNWNTYGKSLKDEGRFGRCLFAEGGIRLVGDMGL